MSNAPKINLRNAVTECAQSIPKENAGKIPKLRNQGLHYLYRSDQN